MARHNDPIFGDEEERFNPVDAQVEQLMQEAADRQGGRDPRDIQNYRWATAADEQDTGY